MVTPDDVLSFWLDDVGPEGWYAVSDTLDQEIRDRFQGAWHNARQGAYALWLTYPNGALAYIILMDQFPRNMFRGKAEAFATDKNAVAAAAASIHRKWDIRVAEPARQFFYMPFMHSENLCHQDRCVRLMLERMPEHGLSNLLHAQAHREVIRMFGRFPYRNEALQRRTSAPEKAYLADGGYGATLRDLQKANAA
ncbi:DUF924 family protein [Roseovarius sp. EL26]|uniref:DUF924 family protein n=1 Tax=Roseovarius sp. EL26 TaxID=2126672 RepID=UPI000EA28A9E|nr:DUF924 family protein [Roseovarius sp. EL26]